MAWGNTASQQPSQNLNPEDFGCTAHFLKPFVILPLQLTRLGSLECLGETSTLVISGSREEKELNLLSFWSAPDTILLTHGGQIAWCIQPGYRSLLQDLFAVWSWESYITPLSLCFLICEWTQCIFYWNTLAKIKQDDAWEDLAQCLAHRGHLVLGKFLNTGMLIFI